MRTLTKQEKVLVEKISQVTLKKGLHSFIFEDLLTKTLTDKKFFIKVEKLGTLCNVEFYCEKEIYKSNNKVEIQKQIETDILNKLFLLHDLCESGLLLELHDTELKEFIIPKMESSKCPRINSNFNTTTSSLIYEKLRKRYYIRQELIDFVNRGFCTEDERRYKKQYCLTWIGIIISVMIGILSVIFSVISLNRTTDLSSDTINKIGQIIEINIGKQTFSTHKDTLKTNRNTIRQNELNRENIKYK